MLIDIHTHHFVEKPDVISVQSLYGSFAAMAPGNLYSLGVHPCYLEGYNQLLAELEQYAHLPNVLAIGECGLDSVCNKDAALQDEVFRRQVALADRLSMPLVVHCVRAFDELLRVHNEMKPSMPVIIHGYNKKPSVAERLLAHNMYLSFGAAIMNRQSPAAEVLKRIAPGRFFLETDDAQVSIDEVYRCAAEIRETGLESLTLQLQRNFANVFKYEL